MADYRYERTDADIKRAFLGALTSPGYAKLTMAKLAQLSRVDRSTIYAHYESIYELAVTVISEQVRQLAADLQAGVPTSMGSATPNYQFFSQAVVSHLNAQAAQIAQLRLIPLGTQSFDAQCRELFTSFYERTLGLAPKSYPSYLFVNMALSDLDYILVHHQAPTQTEFLKSLQEITQVLSKLRPKE
ncbi:TetR/AcrR family transcriptional regulator [Lactiplantibacillus fabifermentans]|uniref:HTH tetR-type domain-containing protein n=2 Tax=Lactiplantibacillus fabifermentans TaxID=483011 RepID=A0A0R2NQK1_9LACO|nr:TetR/AcrR family transcriptional regulator [Lactiplantibacillus fabifermentans]ETY72828.1 hypothetical protein LFAB_15565 [Lactiplantibacillus fabifermentans T30PCM01]KRO27977.1 hypothetical protein DY78_GL002746 [Lactiplantibacillus fabifermentans DSM 21115]